MMSRRHETGWNDFGVGWCVCPLLELSSPNSTCVSALLDVTIMQYIVRAKGIIIVHAAVGTNFDLAKRPIISIAKDVHFVLLAPSIMYS